MNYWHIQLHPNDRKNFTDDEFDNIVQSSIIGMGDEWENDKGQPDHFKSDMKIGDIVLIRHNGPKYLVEITSNWENNTDDNFWFDIKRNIKILASDGESLKDDYNKKIGKQWNKDMYLSGTFQSANNSDFIKYWYKKINNQNNMQQYITLLQSNKNLIFTGAPGTGKTYLAKEIANEFIKDGGEDSFVQFHPSYDYTDFVEGLRPIKKEDNLGFELKNGVFKAFCKKAKENPNKKYVFIIDEINRAEISKVFGELMFSIDPGYRGEKGKVKTQYSNIQTEATAFTDVENDYFYIPENIYIIGTMNDIDRSVESFDFALRRRFAWKEITAKDSQIMLEGKIWKEEAVTKMDALNKTIDGISGLGASYHIGAAYFFKLDNYNGDFKQLWDNHLNGILSEYLRGMPTTPNHLTTLKNAYDGITKNDGQ
jgi:DNA replication protein DnaC